MKLEPPETRVWSYLSSEVRGRCVDATRTHQPRRLTMEPEYIGFDIDSKNTVACAIQQGRKDVYQTFPTDTVPHSKPYCAYFGLTPKLDESGLRRRLGHISKEGGCWSRVPGGWWPAFRRSEPSTSGCKPVSPIGARWRWWPWLVSCWPSCGRCYRAVSCSTNRWLRRCRPRAADRTEPRKD